MVRKDIQQLLQECLEGYDAGLTPEDCLSVYPRVRAELEPLFRQAISLRVAYAAAPRPEFRFQAREKLLFAAGRDVSQALSAEPSEEFVNTTRERLLNRAGAAAQEALRDVPPPRLPFWVNARRRLLETAASSPPKPAHRMPVGMRYALSAAVVVLAVAIAGGGFFMQNSPANQPSAQALSAQLDALSAKVASAEQMQSSGESVSSLLDDLSAQTSKLVEQYSSSNPNAELISKLPDLIQRQQALLEQEDSLDETVASAQERLMEADQALGSASTDDTPVPTETPHTTAAIVTTPEPTVEPTAEPTASPELTIPETDPVDPSELAPGQVVTHYEPDVDLLGVRWLSVTTSTISLHMPDSWVITNTATNERGLTVLTPPEVLLIKTDVAGITLLVYNTTGKVDTVIDGQQYNLRPAGNSVTLDPNALLQLVDLDPNSPALFNMLTSIRVGADEATATPEATSTPQSTATTPAGTAIPGVTTGPASTPGGSLEDTTP